MAFGGHVRDPVISALSRPLGCTEDRLVGSLDVQAASLWCGNGGNSFDLIDSGQKCFRSLVDKTCDGRFGKASMDAGRPIFEPGL